MLQLVAGQAIGPYRLVDEAGSGGMAVVWRAFHARLERYVAIKFLSPRYASDPEYLSRFEREARAISRLDHPNILTVYDYGEVEGWTYMVSPFVGGGTLASLMKRGPWELNQAIAVLEPLAAALDYAHGEGIVHRDIKPSNVLFTDRGRLVLSDFGIARILEASTLLSHAGLVIGTPMYMSPEQADGQPAGPLSDQYSLGVVAYEMLTGHPPFTAETPLALLRAHIDKPLPPPRSLNPLLSEATQSVLFVILAKDPSDRFGSGKEFVDILNAIAAAPAFLAVPSLDLRRPLHREPSADVPSRSPRSAHLRHTNTPPGTGVRGGLDRTEDQSGARRRRPSLKLTVLVVMVVMFVLSPLLIVLLMVVLDSTTSVSPTRVIPTPTRSEGHGSSGIQPVVVSKPANPQPVVGNSTRDPES